VALLLSIYIQISLKGKRISEVTAKGASREPENETKKTIDSFDDMAISYM
jgi:hypothetical protein